MRSLYDACLEREIELCGQRGGHAVEFAALQAELGRVKQNIYPDGSSTSQMPRSLAKLRDAYWQAALESDSRADAKQR